MRQFEEVKAAVFGAWVMAKGFASIADRSATGGPHTERTHVVKSLEHIYSVLIGSTTEAVFPELLLELGFRYFQISPDAGLGVITNALLSVLSLEWSEEGRQSRYSSEISDARALLEYLSPDNDNRRRFARDIPFDPPVGLKDLNIKAEESKDEDSDCKTPSPKKMKLTDQTKV